MRILPLAAALLASVLIPALAPAGASTGAGAAAPGVAADTTAATPEAAAAETLQFAPAPADSAETPVTSIHLSPDETGEMDREDEWLEAPFGDRLLTDPERWRAGRHRHFADFTPAADYNRVDLLRLGARWELQVPETLRPRLGARIEYAFGRERTLYGVQLEQPLDRMQRLGVGITMVRATAHGELQQVEDTENSLALLFGRTDYRDYFEREGIGAYVAWRVPDFSTVSVRLARDDYRSLVTDRGTRSFFYLQRTLRPNPPVDEGEIRALTLRLERLAHRTRRTRSGLYHWVEFERAGDRLGGDFGYARLLADVRSVVRLSPATSLMLRGVGGHTPLGALPFQKQFSAGGVDGLRAHAFAQYRGNQMLLGQAEYVVGLWEGHGRVLEGGLHVIAFVDAGRAWNNPEHRFDADRQAFQADGGFGIGAAEDGLRVYFARNLQRSSADFVISMRLQRPF